MAALGSSSGAPRRALHIEQTAPPALVNVRARTTTRRRAWRRGGRSARAGCRRRRRCAARRVRGRERPCDCRCVHAAACCCRHGRSERRPRPPLQPAVEQRRAEQILGGRRQLAGHGRVRDATQRRGDPRKSSEIVAKLRLAPAVTCSEAPLRRVSHKIEVGLALTALLHAPTRPPPSLRAPFGGLRGGGVLALPGCRKIARSPLRRGATSALRPRWPPRCTHQSAPRF